MTNQDSKKVTQTIGKEEEKDSVVEQWFEPMLLDTTLNFSNNVYLTLKHSDSIFYNEYFLDSKIIDSLTKPHNNRHIEALEIERYLLKTQSNHVKRDSSGLHVKLKHGDWRLLSLDPLADEADNTFEYYFSDIGFYSIRVQWGEGNGYKLINHIDGTETNLFGRPYFSPDGHYVISVNMDFEAGYSQNGFQLFRNENGKLKHLGNYEPSEWGPYSAKWIDNYRLILKNQTFDFKNVNIDYLDFYAELRIKKSG
ncbi:MAG: hypothetical protein OEX22_02720 [Cyclobacteriaceae bacterium]|nr:hypothetical protein [Cyclobacteriaceae bacterium]